MKTNSKRAENTPISLYDEQRGMIAEMEVMLGWNRSLIVRKAIESFYSQVISRAPELKVNYTPILTGENHDPAA